MHSIKLSSSQSDANEFKAVRDAASRLQSTMTARESFMLLERPLQYDERSQQHILLSRCCYELEALLHALELAPTAEQAIAAEEQLCSVLSPQGFAAARCIASLLFWQMQCPQSLAEKLLLPGTAGGAYCSLYYRCCQCLKCIKLIPGICLTPCVRS